MSGPPLTPAAINSASTSVARQRPGTKTQESGRVGRRARYKLLSCAAIFVQRSKKLTEKYPQYAANRKNERKKIYSVEYCNQRNTKRFAMSNDVHHCAPNIKPVQPRVHCRQAVIHLPSGFSIYRLLVSKWRGEGAFQKL